MLSYSNLYALVLFYYSAPFSVRCIKGEPAIEEYYETAKEADKHRDHILETVVQSHQAQKYLTPGRVVVIKSQSVSTTFFLIHHHILIDWQLDEPSILHDKYMNFLHSQTRKDYLFVPFWYHDLDCNLVAAWMGTFLHAKVCDLTKLYWFRSNIVLLEHIHSY